MSEFYHRIRSSRDFKDVVSKGLDPEKAIVTKHIYLSKRPELWTGREGNPEFTVVVDETELERDPEIIDYLVGELEPIDSTFMGSPINYAKYEYEHAPEFLERNAKKSGFASNKFSNFISETKRLREEGKWGDYKQQIRDYLNSVDKDEWDGIIGYYRTDKKILPESMKINYDMFDDDPLKLTSLRLGYGDFLRYTSENYCGE